VQYIYINFDKKLGNNYDTFYMVISTSILYDYIYINFDNKLGNNYDTFYIVLLILRS